MKDVVKSSSKPYLIAETAYGFEGNAEYLIKQTMELPKEIQAIKYHMLFNIDEYMDNRHSVYKLLKSWILNAKEWTSILKIAKKNEHDVIILIDDISSIRFLETVVDLVDGIEVHAACINDRRLLDAAIEYALKNDKFLFIGISGFEIQEIFDIVEYIKKLKFEKLILMYGFQNYPTNIKDVGLAKIPIIKKMFSLPVGYADHTQYDDNNKEELIRTSYILGANIQEIHYIIKEGDNRTDYVTAVSAERLVRILNMLKEEEKMISNVDFRLNCGEKKYLNFRKVPVYISNLKKGSIIKEENIKYIRIEKPILQHKFLEEYQYIGKMLVHDVNANEEISINDFMI